MPNPADELVNLLDRIARELDWLDQCQRGDAIAMGDLSVLRPAVRQLLAHLAAGQVDPGLIRWCKWPDCMRSFNADPGPVGQDQWIRVGPFGYILLCPTHATAGHIPQGKTRMPEPGHYGIVWTCECGHSDVIADHATWEKAQDQWLRHVAELPA